MFRKIILLLIVSSIAVSGFAQKSKQKSNTNPSNSYFRMLIDGEFTPAANYCPGDSITFDFVVLDPNITYTFCWYDNYYRDLICDVTPISFTFPVIFSYPEVNQYTVSIFFEIHTEGAPTIFDTITTTVNIDYPRTIFNVAACQGRDITISTNTHGDLIFPNIQTNQVTPWDTLQSASGCDSLVRWEITVEPYTIQRYEIISCGEVRWGDLVITRPPDYFGDYITEVERFFLAKNPDSACDTLKILTVTIIDEPELFLLFDQEAFCRGEEPLGVFELFTNFTAFDWVFYNKKRGTTFTIIESPNLEINEAGHYSVMAYMDTSLYKVLTDLRITNCFLSVDTLVEDCALIIPDIITPNGDGINDILGIRKLNLDRDNELTIYDRWGKSVFHQKNYKCIFKDQQYFNTEDAFAGLSRGGQKLPDGTYYYAFIYDAFPKKKTYSGTIVILRETKK